jgi:pyruvate formate lyase activating enzyme
MIEGVRGTTLQICGFRKTSVVDYPGEICSTIFVGGCNFRCPYCFNRDLVLCPETLPLHPEEEVFSFLKKRIPVQGALCITGGEPSLQDDLAGFILRAKRMGLKIKLDTNGTLPHILEKLLETGILDYVAVDIKAPPDKYNLLAGRKVDYSKIERTLLLLKNSSIKYELRTTVVPTLLHEKDLVKIAESLTGSRQYVLQQFKPLPTLMNPGLTTEKSFTREEAEKIALKCRDFVKTVLLRGF